MKEEQMKEEQMKEEQMKEEQMKDCSVTPSDEASPQFELDVSPQFVSWLAEQNISVGFSTYQSGKVMLIGHNAQNEVSVFERTFERPMGMWSDGQTLLLSSVYQLHEFRNCLGDNQDAYGYDRLYVPQTSYTTGDIDIHDVAMDKQGKPIFINSLFSCLATTSRAGSFKPLWKPEFITELQPEDRCHLNGLAMKDGKPAYVSAIAKTNIADDWRKHRNDGGIIIDVDSNEIVAKGLSMPHSPRWHDDKLWVANSGTGEFGSINLNTGGFEALTFCPGYIRGMTFHKNYAILGLSRPRDNKTFAGLALDARLEKEKVAARSGIIVVDLNTGVLVHSVYAEGVVTELYDVVVLPGVKRPSMIGFKSDQIRRVLSIDTPAT